MIIRWTNIYREWIAAAVSVHLIYFKCAAPSMFSIHNKIHGKNVLNKNHFEMKGMKQKQKKQKWNGLKHIQKWNEYNIQYNMKKRIFVSAVFLFLNWASHLFLNRWKFLSKLWDFVQLQIYVMFSEKSKEKERWTDRTSECEWIQKILIQMNTPLLTFIWIKRNYALWHLQHQIEIISEHNLKFEI